MSGVGVGTGAAGSTPQAVETGAAPRVVQVSAGPLLVRLAERPEELIAAQELRYRVFYVERAATPVGEMAALRRDFDNFDPHCEHLLVLDESLPRDRQVVATYRLMRRGGAAAAGGFYTAAEYEIDRLVGHDGEILELGRSCVDEGYRTRALMGLLWRGITQYVLHHKVAIMFGCASLPGTDIAAIAAPLSYLYHHHLAPEPLRVRAVADRYTAMDQVPAGSYDPKRVLAALPPLIKGYLRLGGFVGDGAVVDTQFNTTDVAVVVKTDLVTDNYFRHFTRGIDAEA